MMIDCWIKMIRSGSCRFLKMLLILLACLLVNVTPQGACPERCLCYHSTVRCMFLALDTVPKIPPDTTILDLRFNNLKDIPPGTFQGMKHLQTLLLNNNELKVLRSGAFEGLTDLRYLYLYKNGIKTIEGKAFYGLDRLEQLYIHFNEIEQVDAETFTNLPSLERLFLHNNRIQRLPKGIFSELSNLRRLRLDSNALVCDCDMMWLSQMLRSHTDTQAAATCQYPLGMKGKSLMDMQDNDFQCRQPELTVEPTDVEVSFGSTAYFRCRAEGDPTPRIVWLHNNEEVVTNEIDSDSRYRLLEDGTLMIAQTQNEDQGAYECVARNDLGETKATAVELRYQGQQVQPELIKRPRDSASFAGETFTLECQAIGNPKPEIFWRKNNDPLPQDIRYKTLPDGGLMVVDVTEEDAGDYTCVATNNQASIQDTATVHVFSSPSLVAGDEELSVVEGEDAQLVCEYRGYPQPTVTWTRDGRPLDVSGGQVVSIRGEQSSLTISTARVEDGGLYECSAESIAGRAVATVRLVVNARAPPTLTSPPEDVSTPQGADVSLECIVRGVPTPGIRWLKNRVPLAINERFSVSETGTLNVRNVLPRDEGVYVCVAQNDLGTTRAFARLTVLDARVPRSHPEVPDEVINEAARSSAREVNRAVDVTRDDLLNRGRPKTAADLLRLMRLPNSETIRFSRSAEIFERTIELIHNEIVAGQMYNITHDDLPYVELLTPSQLALVVRLSGCQEHRRVANCEDMCFNLRYRSMDGTCNNLRNPMWGASVVPFNRVLPPFYENGFNMPAGWDSDRVYNNHHLPSARQVSLSIGSTQHVTPDPNFTHMLMQWGQFVDHDLTFSPQAISNAQFGDGRFCNDTCDNRNPCFPISVPAGDPRILRHRCMGVTRSSAICNSGMTSVFFDEVVHREQLNQITSFMDASNVYGSSDEESRNLRDFRSNRGLLRTGILMPGGKPLLPPNEGEPIDCQMDANAAHVPCFQAGDHRANEQLGLVAMHTLWMREHNRVAGEILRYNTHWDGDLVFHEARKIVGAQLQHITYKHWLPNVLGPSGMQKIGEYKGYDPTVDGTMLNEFATAAFRFGHSMINPVIYRLNETLHPIAEGNLPLHKAFFAPFRIVEEGGIDPVLRGLFAKPAKQLTPDEFLNSELTEKLFKLAHDVALDLAALNIQRGRDHGLPTYNQYRRHCGLRAALTFADLASEISSADLRRRLQNAYGHPDNIDIWVGGLSEDMVTGAKVGPTFQCLLAEQFKRTRDGDRFWYENTDVFTPAQLTEIRLTSLSSVICANSDAINEVPLDVFRLNDYPHGFINCTSDTITNINFKVWAQCCHDCSRSGQFGSVTTHIYRGKRSVDTCEQSRSRRKRSVDDETQALYADEPDEISNLLPVLPPQRLPDNDRSHHNASVLHGRYAGGSHHHGSVNDINGAVAAEHHMQELMDVVDVRIEGVEDLMVSMQKIIHKLQRKVEQLLPQDTTDLDDSRVHHDDATQSSLSVDSDDDILVQSSTFPTSSFTHVRKMEKKVKQKPVTTAAPKCIDHLGDERKPGENWRVTDCRVCHCKANHVECTTEICQIPTTCMYPTMMEGQCCPVCT